MYRIKDWFAFVFVVLSIFNTALAENGKLSVGANLSTSLFFEYQKIERNWLMDYPINGFAYISYKEGIMEARGGLKYDGSIDIDDLYIGGGNEKSYMKLGYFLENWNISNSTNILMRFSDYDSSYPNNIFYIKKLIPFPKFKITFTKSNMIQELILSHNRENTDINNGLVGFRSTVDNKSNSISIGIIRKIGFPPPNYFLQLKAFGENINEWLEVSWIYYKKKRDKWSAVLGIEKQVNSNDAKLEFVFNQDQNLFYTNSNMLIGNGVMFGLSLYVSLNDWSSAWNSNFIFLVSKNFNLKLGGMLFLGKDGKYFSPKSELKDNNDVLYLNFEFNV